jgi:hypothetical protein
MKPTNIGQIVKEDDVYVEHKVCITQGNTLINVG